MKYKFQPENVSITAGSIDESSVKGSLVKPCEHIFLAEKAEWFEVPNDGASRYETFPGGFEEKLEGWRKGLATS
jgi:hypothetical protein